MFMIDPFRAAGRGTSWQRPERSQIRNDCHSPSDSPRTAIRY